MNKRFLNFIFPVLVILITISCPPEDSEPDPTAEPTPEATPEPTPVPYNNETIIKASDQANEDYFGRSVSLSGDYAIVGAYAADSGGSNRGQAYIFKNNGAGNWNQIAVLSANDKADEDFFGWSVSLSGDYAIVGAYCADSGGDDRGQAYIFMNNGADNWNQIAILSASDQANDNFFGVSVALSGDYAIVGADNADSGGSDRGQAYIFKNDGADNWDQIAILSASDQADSDFFGSVALSGDYAIVGAPGADSGGADRGQAYIFKNDGADNWDQIAILSASDQADNNLFGGSVALSGDYAIVGASSAESGGDGRGQAYIFMNDGADNWDQTAILSASDQADSDIFGMSVSLSGNHAIVGAMLAGSGGTGRGQAYIFY